MKKFLKAIAILLCFGVVGCNEAKPAEPEKRDYFLVRFHTCTNLETNYIPDQHLYEGDLVDEPSLILPMDPGANVKANGWYTSKSYDVRWNFATDVVIGDLDLYAKWSEVHTIFYYLKGSQDPIWTVTDACVGEPLELHDELCDGYTFDGYFEDPECTKPFDLEKPLYGDVAVYLKRDNIVNLNPYAIKRRFSAIAAGGTGSKAGSLTAPSIDEFGNEYVDVNFGYSRSADPYIEITNPVLDISKSQKLIFTFKNLGQAYSFSLYWVSKYENGTYAGGTTYYNSDNSISIPLSESERKMSVSDNEWLTKEVDVSSITNNGISTWGNSTQLIKLRIQFGYISKTYDDLSNVVRFKSIVGVPDESSVGIKDSQEIKNLCINDDPTEVKEIGDAQPNITHGLIFPKNNTKLDESSNTTFFKKEGVLLYCKYGEVNNKFTFNVNDKILCEDYSYLRINLSNYSYISSVDLSIKTGIIDEATGKVTGSKTTSTSFSISPRYEKGTDYFINLFEELNFINQVVSITIKFDYLGVDNAIMIRELEFLDSRSFQSPGLNFNDNNYAGFSEISGETNLSLERVANIKATKFVADGAVSTESQLDYDFDTSLYSKLTLRYYYPSNVDYQEMNKITLGIKLKGDVEFKEYEFRYLETDSKINEVTIDYSDGGLIDTYKLSLNGRCVVNIFKITFSFDDTIEGSIDFSNITVINDMLPDWKPVFFYDNSLTASYFSSNDKMVRYYYGNRYASNLRKTGNVCLKNKSFVYIIYQGFGWNDGDQLNVRVHGLEKTSTTQYSTAVGSTQLLSKSLDLINCRNDKSWNIGKVELDSTYCSSSWYASQVSFTFAGMTCANPSIHIRGIVIA